MTFPAETPKDTVAERLNTLLSHAGLPELSPAVGSAFETYLSLLQRWNTRMNLTAVRDEDGILQRHFVESIACACAIPPDTTTLLDFGSGAGFPGIPIALCRPEIRVTLAESQAKKAAFLQEAVRSLALSASVYGHRAEELETHFDCVTLRAVDHMDKAVAAASQLVSPGGQLVILTTGSELSGLQELTKGGFQWKSTISLPPSADRVIAIGSRIFPPSV